MNVAYIDPPYSRYFKRLAGRMTRRDAGTVVALLSTPAYKIYCRGDEAHVWIPGEVEPRYEIPEEFRRASWARSDDAGFARVLTHAVDWLRRQFEEQRTDVCLVFSDARPFSVAARIAAREAGVCLMYFERGAYRLRSASLSTLGLNARFSLDHARRFEGIVGVTDLHALLDRRAEERWLRLRFLAFMIGNAWACLASPGRRLMQHKDYSANHYLKVALRQWSASRQPSAAAPDEADDTQMDAQPIIVLPLQLESDSQFMLQSEFADNQAFVDFVAEQVQRVLPGARIYAKKHPMDVRRYRVPPSVQFVEGNLQRFMVETAIIVCLNSTMGFEAAVRGRRVICLAGSFYTASDAVCRTRRAMFADALDRLAATPPSPGLGRRLRVEVLRWYQAPGDVWAYTGSDIAATSRIVAQHVRAWRRDVTSAARRRDEAGASG